MVLLSLLLYFIIIYIRPGDWIPGLAHLRLLPVATALTVAFLAMDMATSRRSFTKAPQNGMLLGLFAAIILSHLSHRYLAGVTSSVGLFVSNLVLYFLIVNIVTGRTRLRIVLWVLAILTALLAWQGWDQAVHGIGWAGQRLPYDHRITWVGVFEDPNDLALAFVIIVPFFLSRIFSRTFILWKLLPAALVVLLVWGVYLTNSRGGFLALLAAIAFYFIKKSKYVVTGGIVAAILGTPLFLFAPSRVGLISAEESSAVGRLDAWYYGFQLLKHSPLFGAGMNMFTDDYPLTAHNSFVLAFSELGLVGFFFWIGLIYTAFKSLSLVQKRHAGLAPYAYGLQAALIGLCAGVFFLSRTYIMLPYLLCALSVAVLNIARREQPGWDFVFTRRDFRNVVFLCIGILALLQIAMKTWL